MSFKFGFEFDEEGNDLNANTQNEDTRIMNSHNDHANGTRNGSNQNVIRAYEVIPSFKEDIILLRPENIEFDGFNILRRNGTEVEYGVENHSAIWNAEISNSDIIPFVYEGGLKTWECAIDLGNFIQNNLTLTNSRVLEIGCGSALPGIIALRKGAQVHFQDYNQEVIHGVTIPNIILNFAEKEPNFKEKAEYNVNVLKKINSRFFAGDWSSLPEVIQRGDETIKYEFIITSETIYNPENYSSLINIFKSLLAYPHGKAYIAAKTYYFGVGGGTHEFIGMLWRITPY